MYGEGHVIGQAVSSVCGICVTYRGTGSGFSLSISVLPCHLSFHYCSISTCHNE
jgi:hypothetical protein